MRTAETEALVRKLLRSNQAIGIGEMHTQLACREFLIEHMHIFKEEGVKFLYTEALPHMKYFQPNVHYKPEEYLKLVDMVAALQLKYPGISYEDNQALIINWATKNPTLDPHKIQELDELCEAYSRHDYTLTKLMKTAKAHGIKIFGADTVALDLNQALSNNRFQSMFDNAVAFFTKFRTQGKTVFHMGAAHLGEFKDHLPSICRELKIPSIAVAEGPQFHPEIINDGMLQFTKAPNEGPLRANYFIQGQHAKVDHVTTSFPDDFIAEAEVVDPARKKTIPSSFHGAEKLKTASDLPPRPPTPVIKESPNIIKWFNELSGGKKAVIAVGTVAAVGAVAIFAQKILSEQQEQDKTRSA
ncbi:MAG: hypothetical protein ACOYJ2_03785 [Rickettsiales bacterium]